MKDDQPFVLTPHEVMRGIRVRKNVLVLRPIGWVQAACWIEFTLASAGAVSLMAADGGWWLLLPAAVALSVNAAMRGRVAVLATPEAVTIRNRWRSRQVPLREIQKVSVDSVHWPVRQPAYIFTRTSLNGRTWEVGVIAVQTGPRVECDALVSRASAGSPDAEISPAAMKVQVLRRWIAMHQGNR